jgi:hypothetical protein
MRSLLVATLVLCPLGAFAQDNHHLHHAYYQNWVNKQDKGCCNNQDCGELKDENERMTRDGIEVRIEGEWCPVQAGHYLKRGNAPDWTTSHVCVQRNYSGTKTSACERLLCYQPKPGT